MMEMLHGLGILWRLLKRYIKEIYNFKTLISTLQISGMLNYGKDYFGRI